jgi:hypothetical protein
MYGLGSACLSFSALCLLSAGIASAQNPPAAPDDLTLRLAATEMIGSHHVYILHAYVAMVADKFGEGKVDAAATRAVMAEIVTICNTQTKLLTPIRNGKVADGDRQILDSLLAITELLRKQAQAVSDLTQTGAAVDREKFAAARAETWDKIKVLLGIPDPPAQETPAADASPSSTAPAATTPAARAPSGLIKSNPPPPSISKLPPKN